MVRVMPGRRVLNLKLEKIDGEYWVRDAFGCSGSSTKSPLRAFRHWWREVCSYYNEVKDQPDEKLGKEVREARQFYSKFFVKRQPELAPPEDED